MPRIEDEPGGSPERAMISDLFASQIRLEQAAADFARAAEALRAYPVDERESPFSYLIQPVAGEDVPTIRAFHKEIEIGFEHTIGERRVTREEPFVADEVQAVTVLGGILSFNFNRYSEADLTTSIRLRQRPNFWRVTLVAAGLASVEVLQLDADSQLVDRWSGDPASIVYARPKSISE